MKKIKIKIPDDTRPRKVLLHIARKRGQWVGKATDFKFEKEFKFSCFEDLLMWLDKQEAE